MSSAAYAAVAQRGIPATLNLDDIFGDVLFTPDGETVFMSDLQEEQDDDVGLIRSGEDRIADSASKIQADGQSRPVPLGGGIVTTHLDQPGAPSLVHGAAGPGVHPTPHVPFKAAPQQRHHLQYATNNEMMKKRKLASSKPADRKMSDQQKLERRYVTERKTFINFAFLFILSFVFPFLQRT